MKIFLFVLLTILGLITLGSTEAQSLIGKIANKVQQTISRSTSISQSKTSQVKNNGNNDGTMQQKSNNTIQQNTNTIKANSAADSNLLLSKSASDDLSAPKKESISLSKHETSSWVTIDSTDFIMKYPSDWKTSFNMGPGGSGQSITFSPENYDGKLVQVSLFMLNLSGWYPNSTKSEVRQFELNTICGNKDIDDPQYHNVLPGVILDSSVSQTIYKDFKLLKIFFENKTEDNQTEKTESDIYSLDDGTIAVGYVCVPASSYGPFKTTIETMLKSFQLKSGGVLVPVLSKSKQPIISHNYIAKAKYKKPVEDKPVEDKIYDKVEIEPSFGGQIRWERFLEDSLRTDFLAENKAPNGKYAVVVSFVVRDDGDVNEVKALNDPGYGTAQEAVRLILSSAHKWYLAQNNGRPVSCRIKKTITFELE